MFILLLLINLEKEKDSNKKKEKEKENKFIRGSRGRISNTTTLPPTLPLLEDEIITRNNIAVHNSIYKVGQKVLVNSGKNLLWDARVVELRAG